jgi:TolB-like protein
MTRLAVLLTVVGAQSAVAASPSVAVLDFTVIGGDERLGSVYADRLAARLEQRGVVVITQQTISSMLSLERQRQLLGCGTEATSCVAELAGALGSSYLMIGQVARVGSSVSLNVRAVRSNDGSTVSSSAKTVGSEEAALSAMTEAADAFVFALDPTLAQPKVAPWVVTGLGAAATGVGLVFIARVIEANQTLRGPIRPDFSIEDANALATARKPEQPLGIALVSVGGAAVVSGIVWWALTREPRLAMALFTHSGASWLALW